MLKEFNTKEEAEAFISEGKKRYDDDTDFLFDSTKIIDWQLKQERKEVTQ